MLFLPSQDRPVLVVPIPGDVEHVRESIPWLDDVRFSPYKNYGEMAAQLIYDYGIQGRAGTIGASELTYEIYSDLLNNSNNCSFVEANALIDKLRMIKDETDIKYLRCAAATTDVMIETLVQTLQRPGVPAWKAQVEMEHAGRSAGAEIAWTWFLSAPCPDRPRVRREENLRPIQVGDCVVVGIILVYRGYFGHTLRMLTVGQPSENHLRLWKAVSEAQESAAGYLKPGTDISLPNITAEKVLFEHFPEAREMDKIRFRPCHFIGTDYAEYPSSEIKTLDSLSGSSDLANEFTLQPGMTMEIHPNVRPPHLGFGSVGDVFLVTEKGGERLTGSSNRLIVVEPR